MAVQMGILDAIPVLVILVFLTIPAVWWYWRQRLTYLLEVGRQQQAEIHEMIKNSSIKPLTKFHQPDR